MKICVAQPRPIKGDLQRNLENHKKIIDLAVSQGVDFLIFPELSLTGYEPELAQELAMYLDDPTLDDFQGLSNVHRIGIGVGAPIKNHIGICIGMVLFQPDRAQQLYAKKYLHPDEEAFFCSISSIKPVSYGMFHLSRLSSVKCQIRYGGKGAVDYPVFNT